MRWARVLAVVFLFCGWPRALPAQSSGEYLTLDRIFVNREFSSKRFGPARWLDDGSAYLTLESSQNVKGDDLIRHDAVSGKRSVLVPATRLVPPDSKGPLHIEAYDLSKDGRLLLIFSDSQRVWRQNTKGSYWVYEMESGTLTRLGGNDKTPNLMFAKLSPDHTRVAYVRDNNLQVEDLRTHQIVPLTGDGSPHLINGTFDWAYEEEFGLRDGFRWSPDGRSIAYWQLDTSGVPEFTMINDTDALYPKTITFAYPKVGQTIAGARVGVVDAGGGPTRWMKVEGDPREHYVARLEWAGDSGEVVFQRINRRQNVNAVTLGRAADGETRSLLIEKDEAWVDAEDDPRWLHGGKVLLWPSERDGWRHLWTVDRATGSAALVTPGEYDVIKLIHVDEKGGWLYFIASPDNATQRYLYRSRLDGKGGPQRLSPTDQPGTHSYDVAPDGRLAFHTVSAFSQPSLTELISLPDHKRVRTIEDNAALRAKLARLRKGPAEFFRLDIGGGVALDGWCMKPPEMEAGKKYPLLINVYGEPAGQTVLDRYGRDSYLWHLMLNQHGYVVISVDNRGTPAPRGRAWRTSIFGKVGVLSSEEQAAAVRAISQWPFIDPARIGVWGWSGGGSMTLNAMFRYPELYRVGISVAPVPDQRLYDAIYQERYMGPLAENQDAYVKGSPITFADRLQGDLLVVHGTGDDNVHYQGSELLANALIKAGKRFTLVSYPNRSHGIFEGEGTTRHLYDLLTRFLEEHLPAGPVAH